MLPAAAPASGFCCSTVAMAETLATAPINR
jgi:hypothetical protein